MQGTEFRAKKLKVRAGTQSLSFTFRTAQWEVSAWEIRTGCIASLAGFVISVHAGRAVKAMAVVCARERTVLTK